MYDELLRCTQMGKKKCGIVIAKVAFCIIPPPKVYNANNY
jgi:hypothetical protein